MRVAEKWDGRIPGVGTGPGDWKERARRAEAEAAAARTQVMAEQLLSHARAKELEDHLEAASGSISWRLTAPLRWANAQRRRRRAAGADPGRTDHLALQRLPDLVLGQLGVLAADPKAQPDP